MTVRTISRPLAACIVMALAGVPAQAAEADVRWSLHCAGNLANRHLDPVAVRTYCGCMAGLGDDDEMLRFTQSTLERSYPYAHARCVKRSAEAMAGPR